MGNLIDLLSQDIRFKDSLKACMNCGICTAICPASEFFDYDPRQICDTVQRHDEEAIEKLLRSETIWLCGQCMSCKARCPRSNAPGEIVTILRKYSQLLGYYNPEIKEQQRRMAVNQGRNILNTGYCIHPDLVKPEMHPEQGPIWEWYFKNIQDVAPKLGANYHGDGPGALREIKKKNLDEIRKIYEITGGMDLMEQLMDESDY
ncbi:MAG: 4Fe-4S dicluster domain-containing protein [Bacteroidales bacterium]|nr:4Fe-4S dicluster domain-containing protein [Bacteroidales bacterium]